MMGAHVVMTVDDEGEEPPFDAYSPFGKSVHTFSTLLIPLPLPSGIG